MSKKNILATQGSVNSKWIVRFRPVSQPELRLFCFPYAGGGASIFRSWAEEFPVEIEVCAIQLPGREERLKEGLLRNFRGLITALMQAFTDYLDTPAAFFGHSLGAIVAYELARRLHTATSCTPVYLFAAGRPAPHIATANSQIHLLPDDEFLDAIRKLNGTPEDILQHPELKQHYLPILRADICLSETYFYIPGERLPCPISVFSGLQDKTVRRKALSAWRDHTQAQFQLRMLPGDHFFLRKSQDALLKAIAEDLSRYKSLRTDQHPQS
jgi:surfactin synthase thioesterase subunit